MKRYLLLFILTITSVFAQAVPGLINYQGRIAVGGVNFDGAGQFKFALVNADGTLTHWSNDGTFGGEPAAAVSIPVVKGLYSVLLGDTSLANMQSISSFVFQNEDVRLRVWFNDGTHGFQQLTPDQRLAAAGYAMMAANVPDGSIDQFKLAPGAVTGNAIQPFSIDATHLQNGAVDADKIAAGAVTRDAIADGAVNGAKIGAGAIGTTQIAAAAIGGESWIPTPNPQDGPVGRQGHTVVWTGEEFLIWGGLANVFGGPAVSNTGARYNPATDTWTNMTITGAPVARRGHTAVWTGTEMIIWGGTEAQDGESGALRSGGRYNPATDSWTNTGGGFGLPIARRNHTAVWTGTDMIIWGGQDAGNNLLGDGSKLNGASNFWDAIAAEDAPLARHSHSAIWSGTRMIIWGGIGSSGPVNTGNVYDAAFDVWASIPMPLTGAPDARSGHSVVWTGTNMIVWGGQGADAQPVTGGTSFQRATGARYQVQTNSWHPIATAAAPAHRTGHTAVWAGHEMIVWGGNFATDLGGSNSVAGSLDDGAIYLPATDSWRPMVQPGAPSARTDHTAAWTGREMIVWGGNGQGNLLNTGGRYRLSLIADGAVGARQLADEAVGTGQIATGAVKAENIADGAVTNMQLSAGAVQAGNISDGAVGTAQLAANAITGAAIANGSITNAKLADESVDTNNLNDGAVGTAQMQSQSVNSVVLAAGAVTADKIFNGQVTEPKLATGAVTTAKIADGTVTAPKLALGSVGSPQLADRAVMARHLAAGSVGSEMLAKPPQSGVATLSFGDSIFGNTVFSVAFPSPYQISPVVTATTQGTENLLPRITAIEPDKFSGVVRSGVGAQPSFVTSSSRRKFPVKFWDFSFNNTKVVYFDDTSSHFRILHANDPNWDNWIIPTGAFSRMPQEGSLPIEPSNEGNPSQSFFDVLVDAAGSNLDFFYAKKSVDNLLFGRAGGVEPLVVLDSGIFTNPSSQRVAGNPAVAYYDVTNGDLKYVRSVDTNGTSWNTPFTLDAAGDVGREPQLKVVGGFPMVTYWDETQKSLKCIRAHNAEGTLWGISVLIGGGVASTPAHSLSNTSDGKGIIAFSGDVSGQGSGRVLLCRALTTDNTVWGAPEVIGTDHETEQVNLSNLVGYMGGQQRHLTYHSKISGELKMSIGSHLYADWSDPVVISDSNDCDFAYLYVASGRLCVGYLNGGSNQIEVIRDQPSPGTFKLNWIALPY